MDSDFKLAQYVVSNLRADKLRAISESISPNFTFSSPRVKAYNFDQYCKHLEGWSINLEVEVLEINYVDGKYVTELTINIIDIPQKYFNKTICIAVVDIKNHIIESVDLQFELTPQEAIYMESVNPIPDDHKATKN